MGDFVRRVCGELLSFLIILFIRNWNKMLLKYGYSLMHLRYIDFGQWTRLFFHKKILFNVTDSFRQVNAPIKQTQIQLLKKERKQKLRVQKTFVELILYLVFVFVLYLISFSNRDSRWFHAKEHIDQELITLSNVFKGDSTLRFNQVKLQNIK
jgi:hypothetical protein